MTSPHKCSRDGKYCSETNNGKILDLLSDKLDKLERDEFLVSPVYGFVAFHVWLEHSAVRLMRQNNQQWQSVPLHSKQQYNIIQDAFKALQTITATKETMLNEAFAARGIDLATYSNPFQRQVAKRFPQDAQQLRGFQPRNPTPLRAEAIPFVQQSSQSHDDNADAYAPSNTSVDNADSQAEERIPTTSRLTPDSDSADADETVTSQSRRSARACARKQISYAEDTSPENSPTKKSALPDPEVMEGIVQQATVGKLDKGEGRAQSQSDSPLSEAREVSPPEGMLPAHISAPAKEEAKPDPDSPCQRLLKPAARELASIKPRKTAKTIAPEILSVNLEEHIAKQRKKSAKQRVRRQRKGKAGHMVIPTPQLVDTTAYYAQPAIIRPNPHGPPSYGQPHHMTPDRVFQTKLYSPETLRMLEQNRGRAPVPPMDAVSIARSQPPSAPDFKFTLAGPDEPVLFCDPSIFLTGNNFTGTSTIGNTLAGINEAAAIDSTSPDAPTLEPSPAATAKLTADHVATGATSSQTHEETWIAPTPPVNMEHAMPSLQPAPGDLPVQMAYPPMETAPNYPLMPMGYAFNHTHMTPNCYPMQPASSYTPMPIATGFNLPQPTRYLSNPMAPNMMGPPRMPSNMMPQTNTGYVPTSFNYNCYDPTQPQNSYTTSPSGNGQTTQPVVPLTPAQVAQSYLNPQPPVNVNRSPEPSKSYNPAEMGWHGIELRSPTRERSVQPSDNTSAQGGNGQAGAYVDPHGPGLPLHSAQSDWTFGGSP